MNGQDELSSSVRSMPWANSAMSRASIRLASSPMSRPLTLTPSIVMPLPARRAATRPNTIIIPVSRSELPPALRGPPTTPPSCSRYSRRRRRCPSCGGWDGGARGDPAEHDHHPGQQQRDAAGDQRRPQEAALVFPVLALQQQLELVGGVDRRGGARHDGGVGGVHA